MLAQIVYFPAIIRFDIEERLPAILARRGQHRQVKTPIECAQSPFHFPIRKQAGTRIVAESLGFAMEQRNKTVAVSMRRPDPKQITQRGQKIYRLSEGKY